MASNEEFVQFLLDALQLIGPVTARRMFGGHGLFLDGLMFGLLSDDTLYLKVDGESRGEFEQRGLPPFRYPRGGKQIALSYYQAPEETMDEPQLLAQWGNRALAAAMRCAR